MSDGNKGSGNGLELQVELQDNNCDHQMEDNMEENHETSSEGILQLAIIDDKVTEADTQADIRYKTKHANEIAKVLGTSEELKECDTVRHHLKSKQTLSKDIKQTHKRLPYNLQLSVQHKRSALLTQLGSIEEQYFLQHCQLPKPNDCPEHDDILTRVKHIKGAIPRKPEVVRAKP